MFFHKKDTSPADDGRLAGGTSSSAGIDSSNMGKDKPIQTAAELRKRMHRQILLILLCVVVSGLSTGAFLTRAWFASNREVKGENSSITSGTPSSSLYIRPSTRTEKDYATSVSRNIGASLFPVSTNDLTNWYYAKSFKFGAFTITSEGTTVPGAPVADDFAKATVTLDTDGVSGIYDNTLEGSRTAYYYAKDNIYTAGGDLDVYLNAADSIKVELNTGGKQDFLNAVRVGISYDGGYIIYAPVAESSGGNTDGDTSTDTNFKAIVAGTTEGSWALKSPSDATNDLSGHQAQKSDTSDSYTPVTGATKLFTADENGKDVEIYVWLEGTDGQALLGVSDGDSNGIKVSISYVGVAATGSSS